MWSMRSKCDSGRWEMRCYVCVPDHKAIFISANRTIVGDCEELNHWQTTNLLRLDVAEAIDLGAKGWVINSWHPLTHWHPPEESGTGARSGPSHGTGTGQRHHQNQPERSRLSRPLHTHQATKAIIFTQYYSILSWVHVTTVTSVDMNP